MLYQRGKSSQKAISQRSPIRHVAPQRHSREKNCASAKTEGGYTDRSAVSACGAFRKIREQSLAEAAKQERVFREERM